MDLEAPLRLDGPESFTVRTTGDWTLKDVQDFVGVVDSLFGLILTVELARKRVAHESPGRHWGHGTLSDYVLGGVRLPEQPDDWASQSAPWRSTVGTADLPFGPEVRYLRYLSDNRHLIAPDLQPRIASWHMGSPGHITIKATGGFLKQVRELIKDLSFRNRQERALGDIEIARRHLELEQQFLSPPTVDYLATSLLEGAQSYRKLELQGKLLPITHIATAIEEIIGRVYEEVPPSDDRRKLISDLRAAARGDHGINPAISLVLVQDVQKQVRSLGERSIVTRDVQAELSRALLDIAERLAEAA